MSEGTRWGQGSRRRLAAVAPIPGIEGSLVGLGPLPTDSTDDAVDPSGFLNEKGWLVPPPISTGPVDVDQVDGRLTQYWENLQAASEIAASNRAEKTRQAYGSHVRAFITWCESLGLQPLPAAPEVIAAFLVASSLVFAEDDDGVVKPVRDPDTGGLLPRVSYQYLTTRLAAVDLLHEYAGFARPGQSPKVRAVSQGFARSFGTRAKKGRAAIDLNALSKVVDAVESQWFPALRLLALLWGRAAGMSAGETLRCTWADVTIAEREVVLRPPIKKSAVHQREYRLPVTGTQPWQNPVWVFTHLRALTNQVPGGAIFVTNLDTGRLLTRQAVESVINNVAGTVGGYAGLPRTPRRTIAEITERAWWNAAAITIRNIAMVTTGWYAALRRSNLVMLNWGDIHIDDDVVTVLLRKSKTDQVGEGRYVYLPRLGDGTERCPWDALAAWRQAYAASCGVPERDIPADWPVFPAMAKNGGVARAQRTLRPKRLSGDVVNTVVAEAAVRAGLPGAENDTYGAHSLRVGFVTEALRDNKLTIAETQEVTGHKGADMLVRYAREVNAPKDNPTAKMIRARRATQPKEGPGGG